MAPSPIDVLKNDLQQGLAAPDATQKHQKLLDAINKGSPGFDTPAHRQSRVDRARLAIQFMKHDEIRTAGLQVIDEAIARVAADKAKANNEKLVPGKTPAELAAIDNSIASLDVESRGYTEARKEAEAVVQAAKAAAKPKPKLTVPKPGVVTTLAAVTDSFLPEKVTKNMSAEGKAVLAGVTGLAVVAGVIWMFGKAKDGTKKAVVAGGAILAAIAGWKIFSMFKKLNVPKMPKGGPKSAPEMKDINYGLSDAKFAEAETKFRTTPQGDRADAMRPYFGLAPGGTNKYYEAFMKDMTEKYKIETVDNVDYANPEVAMQNYERDLKLVFTEVGDWIASHQAEIYGVSIGLAAARIITLRSIVSGVTSGAVSVGEGSLNLAKKAKSFGLDHPIFSLLMVGGSIYALRQAKNINFGTWTMPEDIPLLSAAVSGSKQIARGDVDINAQGYIDQINSGMQKVGDIAGDYGAWVKNGVGDALTTLDSQVPDILGLTEVEIIEKNTIDSINSLRNRLNERSTGAENRQRRVNAGELALYKDAIDRLEAYQDVFLRERCTECTDSEAPVIEYQNLEASLAKIDITLSIKDDKLQWLDTTDDSMEEAFDLSADPRLTDKKRIVEASKNLFNNESAPTFALFAAIDELRQQWERNGKKLEGLVGSKGLALVLGNFVYFIEFDGGVIDFDNIKSYAKAAYEPFLNPLTGKDKNAREWLATLGTSALHCALFSLSAGALAQLKRRIIGGGPIHKSRARRVAWNITPGASQANFARNMYRGYYDWKMVSKFGWWRGRKYNNILRKAGLRPEWIRAVENPNTSKLRLRAIAFEADIGIIDPRGMTAEQLRAELKAKMILKIEDTNGNRNVGGKPVYDNVAEKFGGEPVTDAEQEAETDARVETFRQMLDQGRNAGDMAAAGADVEDLLKAGADPDIVLEAVVQIEDPDLRTKGLEALTDAGHDIRPKNKRTKPAAKPTFTEQQIKDAVTATEKGAIPMDTKAKIYADMIKNGTPYQSLIKAGASPDALIKAGVNPADIALLTPKSAATKPATKPVAKPKPAAAKPAAKPPAPTKPVAPKPAAPKPAATKPAAAKSVVPKPITPKPAAVQPDPTKPDPAKPTPKAAAKPAPAASNPDPTKPADAKPSPAKKPRRRPARRKVITSDRDLTGSIDQDQNLGKVDLKKADPRKRGSGADSDTNSNIKVK